MFDKDGEIFYTNEDDGIHIFCGPCGTDMVLGPSGEKGAFGITLGVLAQKWYEHKIEKHKR